jgi:NADPH:quinone reductase-like Zn-dependent oxidoreductase
LGQPLDAVPRSRRQSDQFLLDGRARQVAAGHANRRHSGAAALLDNIAGLVDAGKIRSTVAEHFGTINAANLKRAHALLETGRARGKIVLEGF